MKKSKPFLVATLSIAGGMLLISLGNSMLAFAQERYSELQNFSRVLNLIQQYYVEEVDTKKLIYGAIKGMLRELDPHTNFMPPDIMKDFENETAGEFGGIGIEITLQNGILTVISPIEDTPAWNAGVKSGDKIVAVDGVSTKGLSLVEASQLMKGKKGTKVVLKIVRQGVENPFDIPIVRGSVKLKSAKYTDLGEGFAYLKITSFIETTSRDVEKFLREHQAKNTRIAGLILDLRKNPGGLLDQAVKVSDLFLKSGDIVSTIGRAKEKKEVVSSSQRGQYTDFPLVVLIDESSASASEIVAGALQDNKRALIVGKKSFGKGSVQSVVKLSDGSGLKLTVARYYTPSGASIQSEGITPDIEIEDIDPEIFQKAIVKVRGAREKDIQGHLLGDKEKQAQKGAQEGPEAWWRDVGSQKEEALSPRDRIFKRDYQAYQAFGYLKAWDTLKIMGR